MPTGNLKTYDLTTGVIVDIESMIHILSPLDTPLLGGVGADGRTALSGGTCFEKKVEWQDETLLTPRSTLASGINSSVTTLSLATGDQLRFGVGDVIRIDDEYLRVTGYGSNDDITATRAWSGSAASHSSAAPVVGVGKALPEGSDPENARAVDRNNRFNYTSIFGPEAVQVSGSENVVRKYGTEGTGEFNKQVANRMKEVAVAQEQAIIYSARVEDSTNKWRTFGGIDYWISTNVDSSTTSITEATLLAQIQACYDAGGNPDRLVVGSTQKRKISAFATSMTVELNRESDIRGTIVNFFDSDFGRVSILLDRWVRTSNAYLFSRDQASYETLRPLAFEMLAKTGDSMKGQLVAEKTMRFRRQGHAAKFTALT